MTLVRFSSPEKRRCVQGTTGRQGVVDVSALPDGVRDVASAAIQDHLGASDPISYVLGIYCTSHYIYTKIQAKFLSNQDERAPLVASEAIRVPLGHFASY